LVPALIAAAGDAAGLALCRSLTTDIRIRARAGAYAMD
jgi:hypothetical protein